VTIHPFVEVFRPPKEAVINVVFSHKLKRKRKEKKADCNIE